MPIYLFSILFAPKSILCEIQSIQRNFLWGGRAKKAKFALVSWDSICRPMLMGGFGLRDPKIMAEVQGENLWWRWVTHTSEPWARFWHIKYGRDRSLSQLIHYNEDQLGSPIWTKAKGGRHLVQRHSFWEIQDRWNAKF